MFRYHVTLGSDKKVVNVESRRALSQVLRQEFSVGDKQITLQAWDVEFEDWVNVQDTETLPEKGKLLILIKGQKCLFSVFIFCAS
jgi:hypothetical protein